MSRHISSSVLLAGQCATIVAASCLAISACGSSDTDVITGSSATGTISADAPAFYKNFTNGVNVTVEGNFVVISSKNLPDHKSPYYGVGNANYEAYNGTNALFSINPNRIVEGQLKLRIPITPSRLTTPSPTPLGPIGIALNGVAIFNQYAANNQPLTGEINSFDQYNGHPAPTGEYHYHVEPTYLTRQSRDALVGVLLDGYPVYGPMENGALVLSSTLDAAHGHVGVTKEFPAGIYHYHTTSDAPYINGSGFAGTPGTVVR
ncbi:MAG: YHYH protein [Gemmatimonadaceae bacterium]